MTVKIVWHVALRLVGVSFVALLLGGCRGKSHDAATGSSSAVVEAPVPPADTTWQRVASKLIAVGEPAPDFSAVSHTGYRVRLSSFRDKSVIVYFCPAHTAGACPALARKFRDFWLRIEGRVSMVLGVSPEDRLAQRDFATLERLPYLLVSDEGSAIAKAFGVGVESGRSPFVVVVVGTDGRVTQVFSEGSAEENGARALEALGL